MEREVTLMEMLRARETRVQRQQELMERYGQPIISFCMNIPGPIKNSPLIRRGFEEGKTRLEAALAVAGIPTLTTEEVDEITGCEALWTVKASGKEIKALCMDLEEEDRLGRLWDFDVLDPNHGKWDRAELGRSPRSCLVCGREGKGCASRRLHSVEELQQATQNILQDFFRREDREALAVMAVKALLYEVCTTPKPGLVDRFNNGSHRDMNVFTFLDSTAALFPYFERAVALGQETAHLPPEETFRRLRRTGILGEKAMFRATHGVNTHKGAIFSMGTVCAAAGRLWTHSGVCGDVEAILCTCAAMSAKAVEDDFAAMKETGRNTVGQRLYLERGLRGIRGEVAEGLPSVRKIGLPALEKAVARGESLERAGTTALIALMAQVTDTNLIARGGEAGQAWAAQQARILMKEEIPSKEKLTKLDQDFVAKNLSPGGCADLLAISYFLYFLQNTNHKLQTEKSDS